MESPHAMHDGFAQLAAEPLEAEGELTDEPCSDVGEGYPTIRPRIGGRWAAKDRALHLAGTLLGAALLGCGLAALALRLPPGGASSPGGERAHAAAAEEHALYSHSGAYQYGTVQDVPLVTAHVEDVPAMRRRAERVSSEPGPPSHPESERQRSDHWDRLCSFEYNGGEDDKCFCQLAGNRGCAGEKCVCPQGCGPDVARRHAQTVTFRNQAKAVHCREPFLEYKDASLALLTIPKSYFSHIRFLKTWCPRGMHKVLTDMLRDGYLTYKESTGHGKTMQCIHSAASVSMAWLHLHTFCEYGQVDHMPTHWKVAWCHAMSSEHQAPELAHKVIHWAESLYGPVRDTLPTNCSDMGCNEYGPKHHCSCNKKCLRYSDCCHDYSNQCRGSVQALRRPSYGASMPPKNKHWPGWWHISTSPGGFGEPLPAILPHGQVVKVKTGPWTK